LRLLVVAGGVAFLILALSQVRVVTGSLNQIA
jgi:hypothetical protein